MAEEREKLRRMGLLPAGEEGGAEAPAAQTSISSASATPIMYSEGAPALRQARVTIAEYSIARYFLAVVGFETFPNSF